MFQPLRYKYHTNDQHHMPITQANMGSNGRAYELRWGYYEGR